MRKAAIKYSDLTALAKKHKVGGADAVLWGAFLRDALTKLYGFTGVGRVNNWSVEESNKLAAAERSVNASNRYCHTKDELAALLGITRNTLYRWETGWLGKLKAAQPQRQFKGRKMYDAKAVLNKWKQQINNK